MSKDGETARGSEGFCVRLKFGTIMMAVAGKVYHIKAQCPLFSVSMTCQTAESAYLAITEIAAKINNINKKIKTEENESYLRKGFIAR